VQAVSGSSSVAPMSGIGGAAYYCADVATGSAVSAVVASSRPSQFEPFRQRVLDDSRDDSSDSNVSSDA
jgi:hypothetical protein